MADALLGRGQGFALRSSRGGTRTPDPVVNSHLLYQLSYSGSRVRIMAGPVRVKQGAGGQRVEPEARGQKTENSDQKSVRVPYRVANRPDAAGTSEAALMVKFLGLPSLPSLPSLPPLSGHLRSAGKSGKVARSFPESAVDWVNWLPVSCMPSPESPAKRTTADSSLSRCRGPSGGGSFSVATLGMVFLPGCHSLVLRERLRCVCRRIIRRYLTGPTIIFLLKGQHHNSLSQ